MSLREEEEAELVGGPHLELDLESLEFESHLLFPFLESLDSYGRFLSLSLASLRSLSSRSLSLSFMFPLPPLVFRFNLSLNSVNLPFSLPSGSLSAWLPEEAFSLFLRRSSNFCLPLSLSPPECEGVSSPRTRDCCKVVEEDAGLEGTLN